MLPLYNRPFNQQGFPPQGQNPQLNVGGYPGAGIQGQPQMDDSQGGTQPLPAAGSLNMPRYGQAFPQAPGQQMLRQPQGLPQRYGQGQGGYVPPPVSPVSPQGGAASQGGMPSGYGTVSNLPSPSAGTSFGGMGAPGYSAPLPRGTAQAAPPSPTDSPTPQGEGTQRGDDSQSGSQSGSAQSNSATQDQQTQSPQRQRYGQTQTRSGNSGSTAY